jgi:hypothetical protein
MISKVYFSALACQMTNANKVAPVAPLIFFEGPHLRTNLYCLPLDFYLLRDLKNVNHEVKGDDLGGHKPSIPKSYTTLVSLKTDHIFIVPTGHPISKQGFPLTNSNFISLS